MAKASARTKFDSRFLVHWVEALPIAELTETIAQIPRQRWLVTGRWLLVTAGGVVLLYWNGRLVLSTGFGIGVMLLVYVMHDWKVQLPWADLRKLVNGWNQPIALSIASGGVASLTAYLAASIWLDAQSHWIASGALLQGGGTLAVLLLLVKQRLDRQTSRDRLSYQQLLADLAHEDPLRRLIAVRQLTNLLPELHDNRSEQQAIGDCFRLMLSRETEPIVQNTVFEALKLVDRVQQLQPTRSPAINPTVARPVVTKRKAVPHDRRQGK